MQDPEVMELRKRGKQDMSRIPPGRDFLQANDKGSPGPGGIGGRFVSCSPMKYPCVDTLCSRRMNLLSSGVGIADGWDKGR